MNMIKKISYGVAASLIAMPGLVLAQFTTPTGTQLPTGGIKDILTGVMNWLLGIVGIFGVIGFVIAGILYLTAAGDEDQIARGKKAMIFSIVGVVVALLGMVIMGAVKTMLGGSEASF